MRRAKVRYKERVHIGQILSGRVYQLSDLDDMFFNELRTDAIGYYYIKLMLYTPDKMISVFK